MEILLWLVPSVVVTLIAMAWVGWVGREGRGQVDRDEAIRRLGVALDGKRPSFPGRTRRTREPSTGVALRRGEPKRDVEVGPAEHRRAS